MEQRVTVVAHADTPVSDMNEAVVVTAQQDAVA
jgi:hypothetical protein